jgi:hypothetical protein
VKVISWAFLIGFSLGNCAQAKDTLDPAKCALEVETRLSAKMGETWRGGDETFLEFTFDPRGADIELLDEFLKQRGYFPVAQAPDDPSSKSRRIFFPERGEHVVRSPDPQRAPKVACDASYVSGAKLVAIALRTGMERILEVELK